MFSKVNFHYKETQRISYILPLVCMILFGIYSLYLFVHYQADILALTHYMQSSVTANSHSFDYTSYPVWTSAFLGTVLCIIPAIILYCCVRFPLRMKALALFPSYVVLGLITGISPHSVEATEIHIPLIPSIILLLLSSLAIVLAQMVHDDRSEHAPFYTYFSWNVLLMCIGMTFSIFITNKDPQIHTQLALAKSVYKRDYAKAMTDFRYGETATNKNINALRVLALSKQKRLADELFTLPHIHGSASLIPDTIPTMKIYHAPEMVYNHIKAIPCGYTDAEVLTFLDKALQRRMNTLSQPTATRCDSIHARFLIDYYLCALLLDKKVSTFASELPKYYTVDITLPRHYQEALMLHQAQDSLSAPIVLNSEMDSLFVHYQTLRTANQHTPHLQRKTCSKAVAGSYWNYYYFEEI